MQYYLAEVTPIVIGDFKNHDGHSNNFSAEMRDFIGNRYIFYTSNFVNWFKIPNHRFHWSATWLNIISGPLNNPANFRDGMGIMNKTEAMAHYIELNRGVEIAPEVQPDIPDEIIDFVVTGPVQPAQPAKKRPARQNTSINGFTFSILEDEKPSPEKLQSTSTVKSANTLLQISRELFITSSGFNTDSINEGITLILWNKVTGKRIQIKVE